MGQKGHAPPPPLYFVNAPVDYLVIGGLSILAFLGLRWFYVGNRTHETILLSTVLMWVVNWPHFAANNYRLYISELMTSPEPEPAPTPRRHTA